MHIALGGYKSVTVCKELVGQSGKSVGPKRISFQALLLVIFGTSVYWIEAGSLCPSSGRLKHQHPGQNTFLMLLLFILSECYKLEAHVPHTQRSLKYPDIQSSTYGD